MVMCASGDILQAKVDTMLGYSKGVNTYIDGILFLSKERFYKHIYQLSKIYCRLGATGLKQNSPKLSCGLKDSTYLGYLIIWRGINPNQKKVQWNMYTGRINTTTGSQSLIVMIYY